MERNFSPVEDINVLSADVTELCDMGGKKAYLFGVKELKSRMLVHYSVKERPTIDLVDGISDFLMNLPHEIRRRTIVHSDQGFQFTSHQFRSVLDSCEVIQSMSSKGNCLDNSPIESFFGHLKDEADYKKCSTFKDVRTVVNKYISYYYHDRSQ